MPRVHVIVRGRVQGVGFRWFAVRQANRHQLAGWVRNRADGSVEVEAEGSEPALLAFVEDLRRGPSASAVSGVETEWNDHAHGHTDFVIRDRGGT